MGGHASQSGTLVYRSGAGQQTELAWVDRAGRTTEIAALQGLYGNVELSPDNTRVAFDRQSQTGIDVWVMDLQRRIPSKLTLRPPINNVAIWSPDGRTVAFASNNRSSGGAQPSGLDIYQRPSNMSAPDELLSS